MTCTDMHGRKEDAADRGAEVQKTAQHVNACPCMYMHVYACICMRMHVHVMGLYRIVMEYQLRVVAGYGWL